MYRKIYAFAAFCVLYASLLLLPLIFPPNAQDFQTKISPEFKEETQTLNLKFDDKNTQDDYHPKFAPPEWWVKLNENEPRKYPIFSLSRAYPLNEPPACPPEICRWKTLNFRTQSKEYMTEVLKYAFAGNLETDWRVQDNRTRKWFHAPWMHTTDSGREFVRGLTRERRLCKEELLGETNVPCPSDKRKIENWAVGIYNDRGAYYIGRVWQEVLKNRPDARNFPEKGFPEDTVTLKLLFTQADKTDADFLENSVEWLVANNRKANADMSAANCQTADGFNKDCLRDFRLLQIDLAVRDDRAPTGWVFATFVYHNRVPPIFDDYQFPAAMPETERENLRRWLRLELVGTMFGNDEQVKIGDPLSESVINRPLVSKQKLGCGGRLNGPVDNPVSSCMSCHALAETERNLKLDKMPYPEIEKGCADEQRAKWFRNVNPRSADLVARTFTKSEPNREVISLDYSLQLREGIMRYCDENKEKCGWTTAKRKTLMEITRSGLEKLVDKVKEKQK
jgi:hypothetical protein